MCFVCEHQHFCGSPVNPWACEAAVYPGLYQRISHEKVIARIWQECHGLSAGKLGQLQKKGFLFGHGRYLRCPKSDRKTLIFTDISTWSWVFPWFPHDQSTCSHPFFRQRTLRVGQQVAEGPGRSGEATPKMVRRVTTFDQAQHPPNKKSRTTNATKAELKQVGFQDLDDSVQLANITSIPMVYDTYKVVPPSYKLVYKPH